MSNNSEIRIYEDTIDYVDLYEIKSVRTSQGRSIGQKGVRYYKGTSSSQQQWNNLGRGVLKLTPDNIYFIGNGQTRTINRNKIIAIDCRQSEIEINVSNRQKSIVFAFPGRNADDMMRLGLAIKNGETSVALTYLSKPPKSGCYIATYVYGDYNSNEVLILRDFRDNILLKNFLGKIFVTIYYQISPILIRYFNGKFFKKSSKFILNKLVEKLK